jgi:hypothetical protein
LQDEGVIKFADAFNALMEGIAEKCDHLQPEYRAG